MTDITYGDGFRFGMGFFLAGLVFTVIIILIIAVLFGAVIGVIISRLFPNALVVSSGASVVI